MNYKEYSLSITEGSTVEDETIDLLAKGLPLNYYELRDHIEHFIKAVPKINILSVRNSERTVGVICLLDRILNYQGVNIDTTGMSYMAIHPDFQNSDAGKLLKTAMFEHINRHSDMSLGFARKALDNYWYPYGYRGITNFGRVTFALQNLPKGKSNLVVKQVDHSDIDQISSIYHNTHKNMVSSMIRDREIWEFYLNKCTRNKIDFKALMLNHEMIGYYISKDNTIYEVGLELDNWRNYLKGILHSLRSAGHSEIAFETGVSHPFLECLAEYEHSISTRFVWKGGHVARINSVGHFLNKIRKVLEHRLIDSNIKDFDLICNGIRFRYSNNNLTIESIPGAKSDVIFDTHDWVKLIFGVVNPVKLRGYQSIAKSRILSTLFPLMQPQILWLDQF